MLGGFLDGCRDELIITTKVFGQMGPSNSNGVRATHLTKYDILF